MSRYSQQIILPEIGRSGQEKFSKAKILIIGAGGLGTPVATYLASAGIGKIGIVDGDKVSETNLHRQFLFMNADIGLSKSDVLKQKLEKQNPETEIVSYNFFIAGSDPVADYDIVCDCTDNAEARIVIDEICGRLGKPLVFATARGWEGYLTTLHYRSRVNLKDIFTEGALRDEEANNCSVSGIVNTVCGVIGSLQANEVIKIILDLETVFDGEILCVNLQNGVFRKFKLSVAART